jgi:hypothetical protein
MSLENDWNKYGDTSKISLDDSKSTEGNSSLLLDGGGGPVISIKSETDTPTEARIKTKVYQSDNKFRIMFRYQDGNNQYYFENDNANNQFEIEKFVNGDFTLIDRSEGNSIAGGSWELIAVTMWLADGDLRFRLEESTDGGSTWSQVGTDLVDTNPDLGGGGGVGLDTLTSIVNWDETEVFY